MDDIFRFFTLRPAELADAKKTVPLLETTKLSQDLHRASTQRQREAVHKVAEAHASGPAFVKDPEKLQLYGGIAALEGALASEKAPDTLKDLATVIGKAFGATPQQVVAGPGFQEAREKLSDTLLAAKVLSTGRSTSLSRIAAAFRVLDLVRRAAAGDPMLDEPGAVAEALDRTILLPAAAFSPPPARRTEAPGTAAGRADTATRLNELRDSIRKLETAVSALGAVRNTDLVVSETARAQVLRHGAAPSDASVADTGTARTPATLLSSGLATSVPAPGEPSPLALRSGALDALPAGVKETLAAHHLDASKLPVTFVAESLAAALAAETKSLGDLTTPYSGSVMKLGTAWTAISPYLPSATQPATSAVPTTHGSVKSVGIGDLLVVKQQLKRYEGGEVAHIENVLKSEMKRREHRRATQTETFVASETETTTQEERDLQSTERYELQREVSSSLKEDSNLKVGVAVSASYGGMLEVKSSLDYGLASSKQESAKEATRYGKDVTVKSSSKVSERIREQKTVKVVEEFEEKNEHRLDNTQGPGHVIGVYQWVDKVYEAQVFNYGQRLLFDLMVPEPAAFYIAALTAHENEGEKLVKPEPFTALFDLSGKAHELTPQNISPNTYGAYVGTHGASGVEAPPKPFITVSKTFDERAQGEGGANLTKTIELAIPDGYEALSGTALCALTGWAGTSLTLFIGRQGQHWSIGDPSAWSFPLNHEVGSIPIGIATGRAASYAVTIEITCVRTTHALESWGLKVYSALRQAYLKKLQDYEEKLAAKAVDQGIQIKGNNPGVNRVIERTELKKACISVFTQQHYDLFGAIKSSPEGLPETDLAKADTQGRYVRFFEQAFEWEQATYFFYPYFWGRKPGWVSRLVIQDTDPLFTEFLKAGAARVVAPARPGFEDAIVHFMETGEIWDGADLPEITSPTYLNIIEELKEHDKAPGTEKPQGAPWDVRLPTMLVRLRDDGQLPVWKKNDAGEWLPA